ncbi:unnamed protein product, partial [Didymodactylos carnosus]
MTVTKDTSARFARLNLSRGHKTARTFSVVDCCLMTLALRQGKSYQYGITHS